MAAMLFVSLSCVLTVQSPVSGALVILAILSPPVLLGIERGNIDVLVFSILVLGVSLLSIMKFWKSFSHSILIISLTVLKIYPIAAVALLLRNRRGFILSVMVATLACLALVFSTGEYLSLILANTPTEPYGQAGFGSAPLFLRMFQRFGWVELSDHASVQVVRWIASGVALSCATLLAVITKIKASRLSPLQQAMPLLKPGELVGDLAIACTSIFVFSFLLGSNFGYRLVFLLGILPSLLTHYEQQPGWRTLVAPGALVLFLWLTHLTRLSIDQFSGWLIFFGAAIWLTVNLDAALIEPVRTRMSRV
jgi:hypothetical protein